jgi:hypothetical protein
VLLTLVGLFWFHNLRDWLHPAPAFEFPEPVCRNPRKYADANDPRPAWRMAFDAWPTTSNEYASRGVAPWAAPDEEDRGGPFLGTVCDKRRVIKKPKLRKAWFGKSHPSEDVDLVHETLTTRGSIATDPVAFFVDTSRWDSNLFHTLVSYGSSFYCTAREAAAMRRRDPEQPIIFITHRRLAEVRFGAIRALWSPENTTLRGKGTDADPYRVKQVLEVKVPNQGICASHPPKPNLAVDPTLHALTGDVLFLAGCPPRQTNAQARGASLIVSQRAHSRLVVDDDTGDAETVHAAIRSAVAGDTAVQIVKPSALSMRQQMCAFARSRMVVAAHGAELTHLLWMPPRSTAVEVSLRKGWCCRTVTIPMVLDGAPCPLDNQQCAPYHKADYVLLAARLGHRYVEYANVTFATKLEKLQPINRCLLFVNSTDIAAVVAREWDRSAAAGTGE